MRETNKEDLKQAYKSEKDPRIKIRILAVHMVRVSKKSIDETAANLMQSERWVHNWLRRYDEGGLDDLRDLPQSSRSMQTRHWEASSDYTQAFHQAPKLSNMTAWNAESCLTEAV